MKISLIIPIYRVVGQRFENFVFNLNRIESVDEIDEIIIAEQSSDYNVYLDISNEKIKHHVFDIDSGVFYKTKLLNMAAEVSSGDWLWFHDADIYIPFKKIISEMNNFNSEKDAFSPYTSIINLDKSESETFVFDKKLKIGKEDGDRFFTDFAGGSFAIKKDKFYSIGKWDEQFVGWGFEDKDMSFRCKRLLNIQELENIGVHLYHEVGDKSNANNNKKIYESNKEKFFSSKKKIYFNNLQYNYKKIRKNIFHIISKHPIHRKREKIAEESYKNANKSFSDGKSLKIINIFDDDLERSAKTDFDCEYSLPYITDLMDSCEKYNPDNQDIVIFTNSDCPVSKKFYDICSEESPLCFFRINGPEEDEWAEDWYDFVDDGWKRNKTGIDGFCMTWGDWKSFKWPDVFIGEVYWDPLYLELMRERLGAKDNTTDLYHVEHKHKASVFKDTPSLNNNKDILIDFFKRGEIHALRCNPIGDSIVWDKNIEQIEFSEIKGKRNSFIVKTAIDLDEIFDNIDPHILWNYNFRICKENEWPYAASAGLEHIDIPHSNGVKISVPMLKWYTKGVNSELKDNCDDVAILCLCGNHSDRWRSLYICLDSILSKNSISKIVVVSDQKDRVKTLKNDFKDIFVIEVECKDDIVFCKESFWNIGGFFCCGAGAKRLYFIDADVMFCEDGMLNQVSLALELNQFAIGSIGKKWVEWDVDNSCEQDSYRILWGKYCEQAMRGEKIEKHFTPGGSICLNSKLFLEINGFSILGVPVGGDHMFLAETCEQSWEKQHYSNRNCLLNGIRRDVVKKTKDLKVTYFSVGDKILHISHKGRNSDDWNKLEKKLERINWKPQEFFRINNDGLWRKYFKREEYEDLIK